MPKKCKHEANSTCSTDIGDMTHLEGVRLLLKSKECWVRVIHSHYEGKVRVNVAYSEECNLKPTSIQREGKHAGVKEK